MKALYTAFLLVALTIAAIADAEGGSRPESIAIEGYQSYLTQPATCSKSNTICAADLIEQQQAWMEKQKCKLSVEVSYGEGDQQGNTLVMLKIELPAEATKKPSWWEFRAPDVPKSSYETQFIVYWNGSAITVDETSSSFGGVSIFVWRRI